MRNDIHRPFAAVTSTSCSSPSALPTALKTLTAPARTAFPVAPTAPSARLEDARRREVESFLGEASQAAPEPASRRGSRGGVLGFLLGDRRADSTQRRGGLRDAIRKLFTGETGKRGASLAVGGAMLASVAMGVTGCAGQAPQVPDRPTTSHSAVVDPGPSAAEKGAAARAAAAHAAAAAEARAHAKASAAAHATVDRIADDVLGHKLPRGHDVHDDAQRLVDRGHPERVRPQARAAIDRMQDQQMKRTIAKWSHTAPTNSYAHVSRNGETLDRRTAEMMDRANVIMREQHGHAGFSFYVVQGSFSTGVSASGGTHDGGGAIDVHTASYGKDTVDDMVKSLRQAGFAAWSRGRGYDSFDPHIHAIAIGDQQASYGAKAQVQQYFNGLNGLADYAGDPDSRLGRAVPDWAKKFNA